MTLNRNKILIVDDEPDIVEFLRYNLIKEGLEVASASNGKEALRIAEEELPALVILDIMMPELNGIETCKKLRENKKLKDILVLFLTAINEEYSQIEGFNAGADDYVAKPVKPSIIVSRIKALLRRLPSRSKNASEKENEKSDFIIDRDRYLVIKKNQEFVLPKKEFELLALLVSKPGKVFSRDEILRLVWGDEIIVGDRTIDVHVRKLREKFGPDYIKTIVGVGYKFEP